MEKSEGEKLHRYNIGYYISGNRVVVCLVYTGDFSG